MAGKKNIAKIVAFSILFIIPIVLVSIFSPTKNMEAAQPLDHYFQKEVELDSLDAEGNPVTITQYHYIPEFAFPTHLGDTLTNDRLRGNLTVANFFFTTCPGICPMMTNQMHRLQKSFLSNDQLNLVSFTVDPERDSVEALKEYADLHDIIPGKWHLLTGSKKELYDVARNGFYVTAEPGDGGPEDFIHSEKFILLDRQMRIRGYYSGIDSASVQQLMGDIVLLMEEG